MPSMDVFNSDAFSTRSLTTAIESVPYQPQMLGSMGIFEPVPIRTETIMIESRDGALSLIQTDQRGAPPAQRTTEKRKMRDFRTSRLAKSDTIRAAEIQGIRAFGSESELASVQSEVMRRMTGPTGLLRDIELTWENHRLGAVQGIVLDADGTTEVIDWYDAFGVAVPTEIDFALGTTSTDVRGKCSQVVRAMQRAAKGSWLPTTRVVGLASDEFFDALVAHDDCQETYKYQQGEKLREQTAWRTFDFGGITFVNYRGTDDNSTVAIGANKCKFFPVGAPGVFQVAMSPGESLDMVNTLGRPVYGLIVPDPTVRKMYVDIEVYSYPLFICTRPLMLQSARKS